MAKCANCGKTTTFGHNRSFSQRATNRDLEAEPAEGDLPEEWSAAQASDVHQVHQGDG